MMSQVSRITGPHKNIPAADAKEQLLIDLLDRLWETYRERVEYVHSYEKIIYGAGATFANDHIAFRTFAGQKPLTGISALSRIFETLGYRPAGVYFFVDKHLNAIHYQHPNAQFPKIFISELKTWELSASACEIIDNAIANHREPVLIETLRDVEAISRGSITNREQLLRTLADQVEQLPWNLPEKGDVEALNEESQYAAWVLVHGYNVNHFTALINSHQIDSLDDIEKTIQALQAAGVPMKDNIEGKPGSKLRQSATGAVEIDVAVMENGKETTMPWSYAYLELAQRGNIIDSETGESVRFEGFLGPQATHLFEMTKRSGS